MLLTTLRAIFRRDINKLKNEISAYRNESNLWRIDKNIANSGGNLCLHLLGNLNTYIGAVIGTTGYMRNRELEFSAKDIPREELLAAIDKTMEVVDTALGTFSEADLANEYPLLVLAEKTSTGFFLVHLTAHLGYHLGQINYHRRLIDQS